MPFIQTMLYTLIYSANTCQVHFFFFKRTPAGICIGLVSFCMFSRRCFNCSVCIVCCRIVVSTLFFTFSEPARPIDAIPNNANTTKVIRPILIIINHLYYQLQYPKASSVVALILQDLVLMIVRIGFPSNSYLRLNLLL